MAKLLDYSNYYAPNGTFGNQMVYSGLFAVKYQSDLRERMLLKNSDITGKFIYRMSSLETPSHSKTKSAPNAMAGV